MPASQSFTLAKAERICSKKLTDRLFNGSSGRSLSAFPLRMVYTVVSREEDAPAALMLVSVPKRHFKRAVKRNRVKRQVREAFRKTSSYCSRDSKAVPTGKQPWPLSGKVTNCSTPRR